MVTGSREGLPLELRPPVAQSDLTVTLVPVTAGGTEPPRGSVTYRTIYLSEK